jgi:hypothetical protein
MHSQTLSDLGYSARIQDNSVAHGALSSCINMLQGTCYFSAVADTRTRRRGGENGEERGLACVVCCNISSSKQILDASRNTTSKLGGTTVPSRLVRARGVWARVRRAMAGHDAWECRRVCGVV